MSIHVFFCRMTLSAVTGLSRDPKHPSHSLTTLICAEGELSRDDRHLVLLCEPGVSLARPEQVTLRYQVLTRHPNADGEVRVLA